MSLKLEAGESLSLVESMAVDLAVAGKVNQPSAIDQEVDAITLDAINKVELCTCFFYHCSIVAVLAVLLASVFFIGIYFYW